MPTLSEDDSDESEGIWQQVPTKNPMKRRLTKSPNMHLHKKLNLSIEPNSQGNQFEVLNVEEDEDNCQEEQEDKSSRPPPIYVPYVENISIMIKSISKVVSSNDFNYKSMRDSQIRLMVKNIASYRTVVKHLESKNICFHTYQLKQERAYRVVVKGMHHTTPVEDIKAELLLSGHRVRDVFNIKSHASKQPLSMFYVDLEPNPNNKEIYNIKHINNAIVYIEPPKKTDDLVQCYRCQQFGHTKSYCKKPFRCVKCGCDHPTAECTKEINTPPKCVHCQQNHTASYRGCNTYQELMKNKKRNLYERFKNQTRSQQFHANTKDFPQLNPLGNNINYNASNNETRNISYSQAVSGNNSENNVMLRLEAMLDKLMNLMTVLITKLCK